MPDTASLVTLSFNGTPLACTPGLTLGGLLARQGVASAAVATAVNSQFVPREQRDTHPLQPGDEVLTFQAIVGG